MLQRVFFGNFPGLRASGKFFEKSFGEKEHLAQVACECLKLECPEPDLTDWTAGNLISPLDSTTYVC